MGILYIIATPLGNLKDITLRALEVLGEVDSILAEDTRVTKKLLSHYGIQKPLRRYDEYAGPAVYQDIENRLRQGEKIALVSDAGTPAIADPGARLIQYLNLKAKIIPIPGPSAVTTVLSAAGLNADQFTFLGYPPHKKGREKFFRELRDIKIRPVVLYESPHRVQKTLSALGSVLGADCRIVVARELTKIHEEIFKGTVEDAGKHFQGERLRGEFVLVIP